MVTFDIPVEAVTAFLFAMVRAAAWVWVTPPFASSSIPARVRVAVATALALGMSGSLDPADVPHDTVPFVAAIVYQAFVGFALGFVVMLLFAAVQAAGEMIDFSAGFSAASLYDPLSNTAATPIGRLYQLLLFTLLFAINGHLILVGGFLRTFEAAPLSGPRLDDLSRLLTDDLSVFFAAAVQVAFPLLAALFMAEIVLGLLSRAAPKMNVFMLGFSIKTLLALFLVGLAVPVMPDAVSSLLSEAVTRFNVLGGS